MIQSDTDDTSSEGSFEMLCSTSVLSMVQEEEEGENLSEQLERLLAKYEDPDAQDATFLLKRGFQPFTTGAGGTIMIEH